MTGPIAPEDLVALALDQLDDAQAADVRVALDRDAEAKAEADAIGRHLALHEAVPALEPAPAVWERIRDRLDEPTAQMPRESHEPREPREPARERSLLMRFWMPLAAAALIVAAFIVPRLPGERPGPRSGANLMPLFGDCAAGPDGQWSSRGVSRFRLDDTGYLTVDAGTKLQVFSPTRLALEAGRAFFEVEPGREGLTVACGEATITTLGTRFLVEALESGHTAVHVERGRVRCSGSGEPVEVAAGGSWATGPLPPMPPGYATAWFTLPTMSARLTSPTTLRVVITNEMPDPIELAPPTGGEPFFFARFGGHQHHLTVDLRAPLRLAPGERHAFDLTLPVPVPPDEIVEVSTKKLGLRTEATR